MPKKPQQPSSTIHVDIRYFTLTCVDAALWGHICLAMIIHPQAQHTEPPVHQALCWSMHSTYRASAAHAQHIRTLLTCE